MQVHAGFIPGGDTKKVLKTAEFVEEINGKWKVIMALEFPPFLIADASSNGCFIFPL